jgi:hypothetical protein
MIKEGDGKVEGGPHGNTNNATLMGCFLRNLIYGLTWGLGKDYRSENHGT